MFGLFSKKKKPVKSAAKKKEAGDKPVTKKAAPEKPTAKKDSLKAAIAALETEPPVSAGATLDRAKDALAKRTVPTDRKQLIEQALAIQKTQAKLLDKLPDETRQKLRAMAMKVFVMDEAQPKKKLH